MNLKTIKELEESLQSVRNEVEYFTNRYNEIPNGEYRDQIWVILLLAKAGEQAILDEILSSKQTIIGVEGECRYKHGKCKVGRLTICPLCPKNPEI